MKTPNRAVVSSFLGSLWPDQAGLIAVVSLPDPRSWFCASLPSGVDAVMHRAATHNVYITTGAYHTAPDSGRGTEDMVSAIPGFWADIDVRGPAHKAENLPPTINDAKQIVAAAGLAPTLLVHSGHGLQAWWLFKEPWVFESDAERRRAKQLSVAWQTMLRRAAEQFGWTIDGTADLCRLLRVPGTLNHKIKDHVISVRYRESGPRYPVSELAELVEDLIVQESAPPAARSPYHGPPSNLPPIIDGCAWMRHCQDDAATLPEPEWYQALTVVARCVEPAHFAHRISKPYPKYSIGETDAKLRQASKAPGPVTCRFVETNFGETRFCLSCPNQGRIKSPIQIGEPRAIEAPDDEPPPYHDAMEPDVDPPELIPDWRSRLQRKERRLPDGGVIKGATLLNTYNAGLPLLHDPALRGAIAYDELRRRITIVRPLPFERVAPSPWEDRHDIGYAVWCQSNKLDIGTTAASEAVVLVAQRNRYHPVRNYLSSLKWDECPRISRWLPFYCGTEDSAYTQTIGRKWLISAVARAMNPGCKVDTCLILEGQQGILKSTALATLGGEWYTDEIEDLTSKDAAQQVSRVWIIEMGELSAMSRSEKNIVKAFLSRSVDQFRPAYGRHVQVMPRQCVFAGTTNQSEYFEDETGNRRFWPATCTRIQIDELARDRDQLWAEAVAAYADGEPWWIDDDGVKTSAASATAERMREDPWTAKVAEWVESRLSQPARSLDDEPCDRTVSASDVLSFCLEKPQRDWTRADQMRVGAILRQCGLVRRRVRRGSVLTWEFGRP